MLVPQRFVAHKSNDSQLIKSKVSLHVEPTKNTVQHVFPINQSGYIYHPTQKLWSFLSRNPPAPKTYPKPINHCSHGIQHTNRKTSLQRSLGPPSSNHRSSHCVFDWAWVRGSKLPLKKTNSYSKPHEKWCLERKNLSFWNDSPFLEEMLIFRGGGGGVPFCFF